MSSSKSAYIIDSEQPAETARLFEQSKLFTSAMGGLFPDELDQSGVRRVLDLGCGPGQWANDVAFDYPEWEVVGVDINATMIGYAHAFARSQGRPNISFEVTDLTRPLAFADASFELINARFIVGFQDKASWPVLLAECRRVLAPGGILLLTEAEKSISTSPALQRTVWIRTRDHTAIVSCLRLDAALTALSREAGGDVIGTGSTCATLHFTRATTLSPAQTSRTALREASAQVPGRTLQGQQYHLLVQQEQHQWSAEVSEIWWLAKDMERGNAVTVCEVALPLGGSDLLTFFRVATKAVMLRSTHPQMSALLTVFLEKGHGFFVFTHQTGESLQARIEHRRLMTEQEALDSYRQLTDVLWFFSQQHPPLVHGSIRPAHLVQVGPRWVFMHASPLVVEGVTLCIPTLATIRLATQSTPAADLSMLFAVIYSAVIGRVPPTEVAEQQAQVMRAGLSPTFATLLIKGVHPHPQERYQSPSELLEAMGQHPTRSDQGMRRQRRRSTLGQVAPQPTPAQAQNHRAPVAPTPPPVEPFRPAHSAQGKDLHVSSEDLAPVAPGRDRLTALGWISGVLLMGVIILLMAR